MRPVRTQTVAVAVGSAAISNAVGSGIREVRLVSTTNCHYAIGGAPTATSSDTYLPLGEIESITLNEGEKIAFIRATADGTAYVTELA